MNNMLVGESADHLSQLKRVRNILIPDQPMNVKFERFA